MPQEQLQVTFPTRRQKFVLPVRLPYETEHGDGIVFRRHTYEWVLPANLGKHLKYDKRLLPVVQIIVIWRIDMVSMWEITGSRMDGDRIIRSVGRQNEDFYLSMSVDRIQRGHRAFTPAVLPPVPFIKTT